jgi:hypothetical protein
VGVVADGVQLGHKDGMVLRMTQSGPDGGVAERPRPGSFNVDLDYEGSFNVMLIRI